MPPLQQLFLRGCVRVSGAFALSATVGVAALRVLCLAGLPLVTDAALQAISIGCPQLHTIDVSGCTQVGRRGYPRSASRTKKQRV